jgi:hypothetical protein
MILQVHTKTQTTTIQPKMLQTKKIVGDRQYGRSIYYMIQEIEDNLETIHNKAKNGVAKVSASAGLSTAEKNSMSEGILNNLLSDIENVATMAKIQQAGRIQKYMDRQKAGFDHWITEMVACQDISAGQQSRSIPSSVFSHLTGFLINRVANPPIDLIREAELDADSKLVDYKAYLETPEAQEIISGKVNPITDEAYTIYDDVRIDLLRDAYQTVMADKAVKNGVNPAKKQKMDKESE